MDVLLSERQLKKLLEQDATADPAAQAPTAGTSSKQAGGQGYPEVGKWESGVTRGPANQVGITKWADVVGSKLNRGKANPLKENEYTKEVLLNLMEQLKSDDPQITVFKSRPQPQPPVPASETSYGNYSEMDKNGNITYPYRIVHKNIKDPFTYNDPYYWVYTSVIPTSSKFVASASIGSKKDMDGLYKAELDKWLQANANTTLPEAERVAGRKTKTGKDVPAGYFVDEYDEYRTQVDPLVKQIELLKTKPSSMGSWYNTSTRELTKEELKQLGELRWKVNLLNKKYYSKDYPYGLSQEENKQLKAYTESIEEYYKNQYKINGCDRSPVDIKSSINNTEDKYQGWIKDIDVAKEVSKSLHPEQTPKKYSNICDKLIAEEIDSYEKIKQYYNYTPDKRSKFDKLWDEWGLTIQIGGSILLSLVLPEVGIPMASVYYAGIDATFNLAIAAYQLSRDQNEHAAMSVLFAILPSLKIGRLAIPKDISSSISKKLGSANIKSTLDMAEFIIGLTPSEQKWFMIVLNTDKSLLETASKNGLSKSLQKLSANGVPIAKEQVENLSKKWIGRSLSKTRLIAPSIKMSPKWFLNPKVLQIVAELGIIHESSEWIKSIEEKFKIELDEKQKKNVDAFFNALPEEIRGYYTVKMVGKDLKTISGGNVDKVSNIFDTRADYIDKTNKKTGKPFTKEEWEEKTKIAKDYFRKLAIENPELEEDNPEYKD